ncbi:MAG: hypothetical protein R2741_13765 [Methanolobus sp.]
MSEKRKNLLLLLRHRPHKMDEIIGILDVTRHAILPQIKILSDNGLIIKKKDVCKLTELGDIVVEDMFPLVCTLEVLEDNFDYWVGHELDSIPPVLLRKIRDLKNCKIAEPDLNDMFELNKDLIEKALDSKFIMGATAFLHPAFPSFLIDLVNNNIEVSIIMSEGRWKT